MYNYTPNPINRDSRNNFFDVDQKNISLQQEYLLKTGSMAVTALLTADHDKFDNTVQETLKNLGESIHADRAYIMKNIPDNDKRCCVKLSEWDADPSLQNSALAVLILPVFLKGNFWGFIGFDDRTGLANFSSREEDYIRNAGVLIAAAFENHKTMTKLVNEKEAAQKGAAAKSEFLSRMSHELRTPMNAIIGMNTIARKSDDPEKVAHCLDQIDISSNQLLGIINDILDMAKIEANKFEIENREFDFEKMLQNVFNVIHVKMDEKQQNFILEHKEEFKRLVKSDELRLSQVLINLLNNAVKFTPAGRSVTLSVDCVPVENSDTAMLHIEVRDKGIGISANQMQHLFHSFEQAEAGTTRKYGGTGLGLAICKKIINLMGGDIRIESELGKGSNFIFDIKIEWGHLKGTEAAVQDKNTEIKHDWKNKTILVAEDIEINQEIIRGVLEDTGIAIESVDNGLDAVKMFEQNQDKYDLILMDLQMPEMDGIEAAKNIRAFEAKGAEFGTRAQNPELLSKSVKRIPIIAMTANAFSDDVQHCLDAGMNAHLAKPIEVDNFFKVLSEYLADSKKDG